MMAESRNSITELANTWSSNHNQCYDGIYMAISIHCTPYGSQYAM